LEIARSTCYEWREHPTISTEIKRLSAELARRQLEKSVLTKVEGCSILSGIAREKEHENRDRINSLRLLGSFQGWEQPKHVQHNVSGAIFGFLANVTDGYSPDRDSDLPDPDSIPVNVLREKNAIPIAEENELPPAEDMPPAECLA
jgi:hypothetical protein